MAKLATASRIQRVVKKTSQASTRAKTSSMNKTKKSSFKAYRGQGR
jgi:hypothetical protein